MFIRKKILEILVRTMGVCGGVAQSGPPISKLGRGRAPRVWLALKANCIIAGGGAFGLERRAKVLCSAEFSVKVVNVERNKWESPQPCLLDASHCLGWAADP